MLMDNSRISYLPSPKKRCEYTLAECQNDNVFLKLADQEKSLSNCKTEVGNERAVRAKRVPMCAKCQNHNVFVKLAGHKKGEGCPYSKCDCKYCKQCEEYNSVNSKLREEKKELIRNYQMSSGNSIVSQMAASAIIDRGSLAVAIYLQGGFLPSNSDLTNV